MEEKELEEILDSLTDGDEDNYDYEGYQVIDDLKLTKEQLKQAVDIMWDIVMVMDSNKRDDKYLFPKGLLRSKNIFMAQKEKSKDFTSEKKTTFNHKAEIFRNRLENSKPLVKFLIKIKDIL